MAPSRPYWKGYLKLSLVSCPVAVYTATSSSERVTFRQINKQTGNRLKQQLIDEETGDVVDAADKGRGFEVAKRTYLAIEDEELDAISIESTHTIDIDSFVPRAQIDERYLDGNYYLVPQESRPGRFRRDPRSHARQGHGRPWPHCPRQARTGDHAAAVG